MGEGVWFAAPAAEAGIGECAGTDTPGARSPGEGQVCWAANGFEVVAPDDRCLWMLRLGGEIAALGALSALLRCCSLRVPDYSQPVTTLPSNPLDLVHPHPPVSLPPFCDVCISWQPIVCCTAAAPQDAVISAAAHSLPPLRWFGAAIQSWTCRRCSSPRGTPLAIWL